VLVSIVIPARNAAKTLPLTLRSIKRQTYPHIEVIVVDGRSSDNTAEIAKSHGARVVTTRPNRSLQRNAGALLARGDIFYFVDADFYLTPGVVQECVDLIHSGADAVIVLNISNPLKGTVAKIRYYERMSYYRSGTYEAARCMTRQTFWKAGGYDPQLYANEDYDLHARIAATRREDSPHKKKLRNTPRRTSHLAGTNNKKPILRTQHNQIPHKKPQPSPHHANPPHLPKKRIRGLGHQKMDMGNPSSNNTKNNTGHRNSNRKNNIRKNQLIY